jgi:hypothetical protein
VKSEEENKKRKYSTQARERTWELYNKILKWPTKFHETISLIIFNLTIHKETQNAMNEPKNFV